MEVASPGPYAKIWHQTNKHTNTSSLNFYILDALPDGPANSFKALKANNKEVLVLQR